jgi:hypothetical protein
MATKPRTKKVSRAVAQAAESTPSAASRKDRVLQARVSDALYRDLAARARRLRVPVSNLVRNILEDSLTMVGRIVEGGLDIAEALAAGASAAELSQVLGWQPLVAARKVPCASCGRSIDRGESAFAGVGAPGGRTIVICARCKEDR